MYFPNESLRHVYNVSFPMDSTLSLEAQRSGNRLRCALCHRQCDKFCTNYLPHASIRGPGTSANFAGSNDWRYYKIYGFVHLGE